MYFSDDETSGYCASNAESIVASEDSEGFNGSQKKQKFMEHTSGRSSLSPSTSTSHQRSSSDVLQSPLSPMFSCSLEDSNASSMPSLDSCELDSSDKLCASSKKHNICKTPTYPRREGPRSNLKIMQNFTKQIIESQENLLTKTIEEQRKLDQEMLNQYNYIFLQQTQMLLTGLQNLNSQLPTNYPTVQQFPTISTIPPMNLMFTETLLPQNNKNTAHPYTSPWHEMQTRPKPDQIEKALPKFTTIPPATSIRSNIIPHQPLVQNPSSSRQVSTRREKKRTAIRQSESLSRPVLEEDKDSSDIEYEQVEYLDDAQNN